MAIEDKVQSLEIAVPLLAQRVKSLEDDIPDDIKVVRDFAKDEIERVNVRVVKIEGWLAKAVGLVLMAFAGALINIVLKGVFPGV